MGVKAAVLPNLPKPLLVGSDIPELPKLIHKIEKSWWETAPFFEEEIDPPTNKAFKSKKLKKLQKEDWKSKNVLPIAVDWKIEEDGDSFRTAQDLNPLLQYARERALEDPKGQGPHFIKEKGLLYRVSKSRTGDELKQLVVPQKYYPTVLEVAHIQVGEGHLGTDKTTKKMLDRFYWPGVYQQVFRFCQACEDCQKKNRANVKKAPLQPMPLVQEPFSRIGIDIVGPIEPTRRGHKYILVVVDYATRYPEAFPLKATNIQQICDVLIPFIGRVGIPREIVTDRGTNFMSSVMKQVCDTLKIEHLKTAVYHPQTDGLVERYNQTIKQMIRKTTSPEDKDWDRILPWILMTLRNTPQSSTGFSPFELLFGRPVRSLLDVLKENWEEQPEQELSLTEYASQLQERIERLRVVARDNLLQAQLNQEKYYNQKAQLRTFKKGDQVLILMPTSDNKMLASWKGPFEIQEVLGPLTYKVKQPGSRLMCQTYHVNLLKKWIPPIQNVAMITNDVPLEGNFPQIKEKIGVEGLNINMELTVLQKSELSHLLQDFDDVFSSLPGRTSLTYHRIETKPGSIVRLRPYRIPESKVKAINQEVQEMLDLGIIEPSFSDWSSPVVLVPKPDGSVRFCMDFRKLNEISKFDAYPMSRIEDLLNNLGKAKFLTTIDLTKGYWQVPLSAADKEKTAFATPTGLYQFTVLPFGLHGAPATFQRLMNHLIKGHEGYVGAYLDDIIVYSKTWQEHMIHLRKLLVTLKEAGLHVNPKKTHIAEFHTKYLGYYVGQGIIRPQEEKVKAIKELKFPENPKQIRAFLGFVGYYRRFIPHFSTLATPLTNLLRKPSLPKKDWQNTEAIEAFNALKEALTGKAMLQCPDFESPFVLQTDASGTGLGAVLLQNQGNGERPVLFISRKLLPHELNYPTIEKECLAVKWAIDALRYYLLGREFTLMTDHAPLVWLARNKDSNQRVLRWFLSLQPFSFKTVHKPGKLLSQADYLSRAQTLPERKGLVEGV
ncbi:uncharacterized protein [Ambystoma mexicanum]|uniref:uncharacterized protein n=1 Tax=Ambystoma mexicanum TaxID=8296 RepID=UPI0037E86AD6